MQQKGPALINDGCYEQKDEKCGTHAQNFILFLIDLVYDKQQ